MPNGPVQLQMTFWQYQSFRWSSLLLQVQAIASSIEYLEKEVTKHPTAD
jgi:hypothetical protein